MTRAVAHEGHAGLSQARRRVAHAADMTGREVERAVGWERSEWNKLAGGAGLAVKLGDGLPDWQPGCGSKSVEPGVQEALIARFGETGLKARAISVGAWDDPIEACFERGWSDGLPVVPPTDERILRMLGGTERKPDEIVGLIPPNLSPCTVEKVAINAVMAGCKPEYMPVLLAALEAALEPIFTMHGLLCTTCFAGPVIVVNGPIARRIGMNWGINALGQGNRANASIGRALRLVLTNIGGARPEIGDMATMGQPAKYTLCFAERSDGPFPTLTERLGLGKDVSAITVMGISGTAEVLPGDGEGASPEAILDPIVAGMRAEIVMSGQSRKNERGEQVILLPLELAQKIVRHDGWDLKRVQHYMFDKGEGTASAPEAIHVIVTGGAGYKMAYLPVWGGGSKTVTRPL